jgi:O-acetyl-ADP-ribose deacetylase (regulator of RNase III)
MRIELHYGNITELNVDCIVNAANSSLLGGGGVDGAIHRAAGKELREFCKTLNGCKVGEAKLTPGYNLTSKNIIHTVGPRFTEESNEVINDLKNCYYNSLLIAEQNNFETIAFSNISTGVFGYPKELAAKISLDVVIDFLTNKDYPYKVIFCCYDIENLEIYTSLIKSKL